MYNLQRYVEEFYDSGGIEYQAERTDGAQPGSDVARDHELATVDRLLLRRIWSWFVCHPDIRLSSVPDCEFVGTKDAKIDEREVEVTTSISRHFGNGKINKVARKRVNGEAGPNASASSSVLTGSLAEWDDFPRLFASEERMWKALTGHGVDHKKVPPHEFKLLSIIAAHGEQGILQPDLVRLSEQDKRSVPKRTDQLHQNGYIVKNKVFTRAMRTSCCVLKTFIRNTRRQDETGSNLEQTRDNNGDAVMLEEFLDTLMAKLKDATILTLPNLRQMLVREC